ncbi:hypothetical protein [Pontibacter virosus]|uniref:DUF1735 domain-containing protein n=1 Tax=Pontibacter virosus TaxID=1765052 RepID=A0A2U1B685_9BACT|nr:hypothetical protein [Pontibacter virosus]PVY44194.1 hypothetical protein C8E01_101560 [Pontibacter virosus]
MKNLLLATLMLFAFIATSCDKVDDLLTFYINQEETIRIESTFPIGVVTPLSPIPVKTNSSETFKNNKTRAELVKDVSLNKLALTIANPSDENFDFLRSIEIYLSNDKGEETKIAYLNEVPKGVKAIELKSTNAKLDKYIKGETYTVKTRAAIAKPITRDVEIKAAMRFKVTADPI